MTRGCPYVPVPRQIVYSGQVFAVSTRGLVTIATIAKTTTAYIRKRTFTIHITVTLVTPRVRLPPSHTAVSVSVYPVWSPLPRKSPTSRPTENGKASTMAVVVENGFRSHKTGCLIFRCRPKSGCAHVAQYVLVPENHPIHTSITGGRKVICTPTHMGYFEQAK
jgi:hypothetical protein